MASREAIRGSLFVDADLDRVHGVGSGGHPWLELTVCILPLTQMASQRSSTGAPLG